MAQTIAVQINFEGVSPIVSGDKRLSVKNIAQLLGALNHGSRTRQGQSYIQVQSSVVAASATATCAAVAAADTVTIAGTALTAGQKRASGTVTAASVSAADTVTLNGQVFTAVSGAVVLGEATFDCSGSDTATATSLAAQVVGYAGSKVAGVISAKSAAAVVTVYAVSVGVAGNAYTLASSNGGRLAVSGATLANGAAATNNVFDCIGTNTQTADSLAFTIRNSSTAAVQQVTATAASGVCTVTSKVAGVAGNTITFVSSNGTRLAVTGSGFLASGSAGAATRWNF